MQKDLYTSSSAQALRPSFLSQQSQRRLNVRRCRKYHGRTLQYSGASGPCAHFHEEPRIHVVPFWRKVDAPSTLTALTSEISKLSPMGPPQYQGEVYAAEHLRNALLGETWAKDILRAMNPQTISFSEFGTNLHCALLLRDELNNLAATHNLSHGGASRLYRRASLANTLY
jgi:hypothetical protein